VIFLANYSTLNSLKFKIKVNILNFFKLVFLVSAKKLKNISHELLLTKAISGLTISKL
jgi:hypothetical protein